MKKNYIISIILLITGTNYAGFSQSITDTTLSEICPMNIQDSLTMDSVLLEVQQQPLTIDSLYKERLAALPFDFQMIYNPMVKKYIELYTVKLKDRMQVMLGLSSFYFPIFDEIFAIYHIPNELKYIAVIESALNPRAVSPAYAVGLWQFIRCTGKENGLIINKFIDERRSVTESTIAAAKYLNSLFEIYNDWSLVLAAYNCGPRNVDRAIKRSGGKRDYWEICKYLPRETRGYVPGFIGAAYAFNYFKECDLNPVPSLYPAQIDTVNIDSSLHLKAVSSVLGIDYNVLKALNPQYLKDYIPADKKKTYTLNIPAEQKSKFIELSDTIYACQKAYYSDVLKNHISANTGDNKIIHRVQYGECLSTIAREYEVSANNIKKWNNLKDSRINKGQKLVIYVM